MQVFSRTNDNNALVCRKNYLEIDRETFEMLFCTRTKCRKDFVLVFVRTCDWELGFLFSICVSKRESGKQAYPLILKLRGFKCEEKYGFY